MEAFSASLAFRAGIHWSTMNSPHKASDAEHWCILLICAWTDSSANNGDLRCHRAHYDVIIMVMKTRNVICGIRFQHPSPSRNVSFHGYFFQNMDCIFVSLDLRYRRFTLELTHNLQECFRCRSWLYFCCVVMRISNFVVYGDPMEFYTDFLAFIYVCMYTTRVFQLLLLWNSSFMASILYSYIPWT